MDNSSYVMFLILGTALVVADGQIIYRSGLRYLANSYGDNRGSSKSMARLVSVLFHFAMLGILALISTLDVPASGPLPTAFLQGPLHSRGRCLESRREPEQNGPQDRHSEREGEHCTIQWDLAWQRDACRNERENQVSTPEGQGEPEYPTPD